MKLKDDWRKVAHDIIAPTGHSWEGERVRLPSKAAIGGVLPLQVNLAQTRRLLRLGIIFRWVAVAFAGLSGLVTAKPPTLLFYLILAAMIYNSLLMLALGQAPDSQLQRLALSATVVDQFFELAYIALYATAVPAGAQAGSYFPGLIEAIAYFGLPGAVLSVSIFFAAVGIVDLGYWYAGRDVIPVTLIVGMTLIVALAASTLVAVNRILTAPVDTADLAPGVRLSKREQEVLRLVAEGYSNTMIATRLNLSDNTIKGYVENLLTRLNARNRAEAVAAASRLKLL